ncbi:MAG: hypothetical protein HQL68_01580 [Magnetococcales bacterium]|nr:hypothetical protein [Magnetococcales bacterium]
MNNRTKNQADTLHELLISMGKMEGILEAIQRRQQEQTKWMSKLDERLRNVEKKAALNGLLAGGMVGMVVAVVGHFFRSYFHPQGLR